ncbi:endolytic transglycosylase MltG [Pseudalkalibacillus sp. SCS-8]|uniref:endolytic transglycosylase MltG n=1 Tax=Pseudalkalibacillus nanhaiensis TaxID=3115291 RepID=UPI0032DAF8B3
MKRAIIFRITAITSVLLLLWLVYESTPFIRSQERIVTVREGQSLREVAEVLEKEKLIKNQTIFRLYGSLRNMDSKVKKGSHTLSSSESIPKMYEELITSPSEKGIEVTIPEGFTINQIADRLAKKGIVERKAFIEAVKTGKNVSHPLIDRIKSKTGVTYRLEGYLFPDTYSFKKNSRPEDVIERMLDRFNDVRMEIGLEEGSMDKWVTLASIVEKEAVLEQERKMIAGVFHNRMKDDWKLQSCATVQYVLDKPKERLLYEDLEVESPYNTYLHIGLPPGPISNPGKESLAASLNPHKHDYYFFVVKGDGSGAHHFSTSYQEHQKHTNHKGNW